MTRFGSRWQSWAALDRRVWQMAFARCVNTIGLSLVMSFLGIYVVETRGYPAWLYGVIAAVANIGQSMSSAWAGNLSDRIGRRPLITTALYVRAGVIALLGTQVALDAPLWSLALNMIVSSTLRGCFEPVAYALVADVATEETHIEAFGLQRIGANLGWAIGPVLGGTLTVFLGYGHVFYITAALMVAAAIVTTTVKDPVRRKENAPEDRELRVAFAGAMRDPLLRLLLAGTFLCALLETQMFSTLAIYFTKNLGFDESDVGLIYTINGLGVLVMQVPALALVRRIGIGKALPWASLIDALGFALIGVGTGYTGVALGMLTLTCAEVVFDPAHQTAVAECADPAHRGQTFGIVAFIQMIGIALAPLIGGILLDTIGHHHFAMWLAIAMFGVGQTACFSVFVRRRRTAPSRIVAERVVA